MGAAAGGLQACLLGGGDVVVHVGMGDGALTKMMASRGLCVTGVDVDVAAGLKRGLRCAKFSGQPLAAGSLAVAADAAGEADVVLVYTAASAQQGLSSEACLAAEALREFKTLLKQGGRLCLEVPLTGGVDAAGVRALVEAAAYSAEAVQLLPVAGGQQRIRVVAKKV